MSELLKTKSLNWSDVNLIAQSGVVESRSKIPVEGEKIVISAMTSIVGQSFIKACSELPEHYQPTIHIPRDIFKFENLTLCYNLKYKNIFVGVGLKKEVEYEEIALKYGYNVAFLDIANGYLPQIKERVNQLKEIGFTKIICGSVHTREGFNDLVSYGVDIVRSGIAPGSVCITSDSTGFTRGTFTEIYEMNKEKEKMWETSNNLCLLADGGIKSPSDYVKAFLAGADYVMAGRPFVKAKECRMHNEKELFIGIFNGEKYAFPNNLYFGMASFWGKVAMTGKRLEKFNNIEGKQDFIGFNDLESLESIIKTIWQGIQSGISYSGYASLTQAIGNGVFESKI